MKLFKWSDILFTVAIVAAALTVWFLLQTSSGGERLVVALNGKQIASLPLDQDTEFIVHGQYTNIIVISGGKAFVRDTDCPNKICRKESDISKNGQTIVCAPNKMTATVTGGTGGDVDAVTQ